MRLIRTPSLTGRLAARTSWKRYVRHSLGLKAPAGYGWITDPRRAAYNRLYSRATIDVTRSRRRRGYATGGGILFVLLGALVGVVALLIGALAPRRRR